MKSNYTITLSKQQTQALAVWFQSKEATGQWTAYSVPYARFAYKGDQVNVVAYSSQKLVVAGKQTASFVQNVLESEVTGEARPVLSARGGACQGCLQRLLSTSHSAR